MTAWSSILLRVKKLSFCNLPEKTATKTKMKENYEVKGTY